MASPLAPSFRHRVALIDEPSQLQVNHLLQLESSDEFDQVQPRSEHGALFCMYEPETRASEAFQYASDVDIVAVHGLGGDAYRTWQHESGFNWLQRLHEEFSGIRVYTFGYDSGMAFSGGSRGLNDHARYLLYLVKRVRPSHEVSCLLYSNIFQCIHPEILTSQRSNNEMLFSSAMAWADFLLNRSVVRARASRPILTRRYRQYCWRTTRGVSLDRFRKQFVAFFSLALHIPGQGPKTTKRSCVAWLMRLSFLPRPRSLWNGFELRYWSRCGTLLKVFCNCWINLVYLPMVFILAPSSKNHLYPTCRM